MERIAKMKALPVSFFDRVANLFYSDRMRRLIRDEIAPAAGMDILDVPCGTGTLFDICMPCNYTGIDIDAERVLEAERRHSSGKFIVSDASKLAFPDNSFDLILASGLFHHIDDNLAGMSLSEFARVLKPKGRVIVFDAIWPRRWYNIGGLFARKMDQGKFVRHCAEYEGLFKKYFSVQAKRFPSRLGLDYLLTTLVPVR